MLAGDCSSYTAMQQLLHQQVPCSCLILFSLPCNLHACRLQEALDAVPRVLCLTEARLFHLVNLLCTETAAAFQAARLSLPPWRQTPAVMDKWLSEKHHDVVVDAESSLQALEQELEQALEQAQQATA